MPDKIYQAYVHFCEMLALTPASREVYEKTNSTVYPLDLAIYSIPKNGERLERNRL